MSAHDHPAQRVESLTSFFKSRSGLVLIGFVAIAGALLLSEHRAHVLGALIFLPLLLCPLMHIFMHGGHGAQGADRQNDGERNSR